MEPSAQKGLPCLLQVASQRFADECAVISTHERLTFSELEQQVHCVSKFFEQRGIQRNDKVMVVLPNGPATVVVLLALIRIGAWCCPINPQFPLQQQLDVKTSIDAQWVVGESDVADGLISLAIIEKVRKRAKKTPATEACDSAQIAYSDNLPCCLILTSGTSGRPKAAAFAYRHLFLSALGANEIIPLAVGDRNLMSLPLFHVGGLAIVFRCLLGGAAMVMSSNRDLLQTLTRYKVTHASMVATQLRRLLKRIESGTNDHAQTPPCLPIKAILVGGGPVDGQLLNEAKTRGLPCWLTYGLTEMSSQVYTQNPEAEGGVLNYRQLTVNDDGEILVRGDTLFMGYYQQGELRLPLNSEGWFETRDVGWYVNGCLDVSGRKDNQFISGGENIQPEEIEYYVNRMDGVEQSIVVPIPHTEFGVCPAIFIDSAQPISATQLKKMLKIHLPFFKIPTTVYPWVESDGLKVSRSHLTTLAVRMCFPPPADNLIKYLLK